MRRKFVAKLFSTRANFFDDFSNSHKMSISRDVVENNNFCYCYGFAIFVYLKRLKSSGKYFAEKFIVDDLTELQANKL